MEYALQLVDFILHINKHLEIIFVNYGKLTYFLLFLIVFCETGLVITPFLPGDSLLFAVGALAAGGALNVTYLIVFLISAAILGDSVNYQIGKIIGPPVFKRKNSRIFKPQYLERTQKFYAKYGNKTIVIARFVPIVRTFAPFLAGVGIMNYRKFLTYNVIGGVAWVTICVLAGYFFGSLDIVRNNFSLVILLIIFISILPILFELYLAKSETIKQTTNQPK
ncbi:MAG TPA: DedA family protein [Oligoflexia bacterium]|nr:DedA family protein [Oligoflexia bacterium]HMP27164.1 DedA family protein [Oligoflexia bacterium]